MKFTIKFENGYHRLVAEDGRSWTIPEGTKRICIDRSGEIWAYESVSVYLSEDCDVWLAHSKDGFVVYVGKVNADDLECGVWRKAIIVPSVPIATFKALMETEAPKPKADGRAIRATVTASILRDVTSGELWARGASGIIGDLYSETFSDYTTLKLVQAFAMAGHDIRNTSTMMAFEIIDRKAQEALA